jgi:hypothetical protein
MKIFHQLRISTTIYQAQEKILSIIKIVVQRIIRSLETGSERVKLALRRKFLAGADHETKNFQE